MRSSNGRGVEMAIKQALPRLRVDDLWIAKTERSKTEAAAMRLCGELTPACVPRLLAYDETNRILAMELISPEAHNWQAEIGEGRSHADAGAWAGATLGTWHAETASRVGVAAPFNDFEAFEQLRLDPFHETVMARRPELAPFIAPIVADLRTRHLCLVHGATRRKTCLSCGKNNGFLISRSPTLEIPYLMSHSSFPSSFSRPFAGSRKHSQTRCRGLRRAFQRQASSSYSPAADRRLVSSRGRTCG